MALLGSQQNDDQHDRVDGHMQAVEAGMHEKRRAVNARSQRQAELLIGFSEFHALAAQEGDAQSNGRRQPQAQLAAPILLDAPVGSGHGSG